MSENLYAAAKAYFQEHIPVVAVKQKKPLVDWAKWQTETQTPQELENQPWNAADGFAIICGTKQKNGLYIGAVDFDLRNLSEEAITKGKQILKCLLTTQIEQTPSGGQHWIYHTQTKPRTISAYHNEFGLELLGEGKLCIMAPSQGYKRLNDNTPATLLDLETEFYKAIRKAGFTPQAEVPPAQAWFDRTDLTEKRFTGKTPPCINALYKGAKEGERNEHAIRLASFLANFRKLRADKVLEQMRKINKLNEPPLDDQELQAIVKSAVNGGYVYGCTDPLLRKNCNRDDCPIAPANIAKMLSQEEIERAEKLLNEGKLLDYALEYGKRRLIGEDDALQSNFVMFCSGRARYPISGVISGFSGSGKNESIRAVKPLIPKEWYFEFTTSTPEAIKYLPEDFDGTLLIYEAVGVKGDSGSLSLRAIGEGESIETIYPMRNELTGKMEMGRAKTNAKNFITTSSDIDINPDLYRRVLKHTMNHSTQLTKRVMAKKLRDAAYPESLKNALGLQRELPFKEEDFQNALRLMNWRLEVIVYAPPELMDILKLATKREQEVALRTHVEKILNFTKVIALINQRKRLHATVGENEYLIAEPADFLRAMEILRTSIIETVSRIEKRQEEALQLFTSPEVVLNKNDVAAKLKVSTKTATRILKTLAQTGYLKEETQGKTHQYQLLQKEPEHLDLLKNIRSLSLFHMESLRNWVSTIWTTGHAKGAHVSFKHYTNNELHELSSPEQALQYYSALPQQDTSTSSAVQMPYSDNSGLKTQNETLNLDKSERSSSNSAENENNQKSPLRSLNDFVSVHWSREGFGWHQCGVCGYTKLTCCQGNTFKNETVWLCEDCQAAWERQTSSCETEKRR
ncbi:MAG: bifunctional DNA primase/polymerase [Candidatus Bathyarchaeota archaeon]|nr:bifunctional DNA primase/polymerase [Candidatus Bathyarchaeota archaeon]